MLRTTENAMPAVTTELDWTTDDLLKFMIQTGRFRDLNGTISEARVEAAKAYLQVDWDRMAIERWKAPGIDPERPYMKEDVSDHPKLAKYFAMKHEASSLMEVIQSGPNDEYTRAENALLMCQRVDLWCAGEKEVEQAVYHLYQLGRALNEREVDMPAFVAEFRPGLADMAE